METARWLVSLSFAAAMVPAVLAGTSMAGELDDKMSDIVKAFSREAFEAGLSTPTLAVLPFRTNKMPGEERISRMCTEIVTSRFVAAKTFRVIERGRFEDVMKEQGLKLSGAVGNAAAAKVGMVSGVRLLVLGDVTRSEYSYQISAKMVDTETGEILASDVTEVFSEFFSKSAPRRTAARQQEIRRIELYAASIYSPIITSHVPPQEHGIRITPINPSGNMLAFGAGVRYFLRSGWMLDLMALPHLTVDSDDVDLSLNGKRPEGPTQWSGSSIQLTANRGIALSQKIRGFAGGGLTMVNLDNSQRPDAPLRSDYMTVKVDDMKVSYMIPTVRLGVEWKPVNFFSLTVFGNYNISQPNVIRETATVTRTWLYQDAQEAGKQIVVRKFKLPRFYLSTSLTFFFHNF